MTTTTNTNAVTTQDILNVIPNDGELQVVIDNKVFFVVGLDGKKNTISLDWHDQAVVTPDTFEISLDSYSSIKKLEEGCYELLPSNGKVMPHRSQSSVDDGLELPF